MNNPRVHAFITVCLASLALAMVASPLAAQTQTIHSNTAAARSPERAISEQEAYSIAVEAYVFFYPIISMDITRRQSINVPAGAKPGFGPANQFQHLREFPSAEFRDVVRPNFDTLYSSAWLDLTTEPMIVSHASTSGRYFLLPMLDMWSNVFAVPGKRTSGTDAAQWAVVPPGWTGTLPDGVQRIDAPTPFVWIIGRTQTNGPADYPAVHKIQDAYRITPLSNWGSSAAYQPPLVTDPSIDMRTPALVQVNTMPASEYFAYAAQLLRTNPPQHTDWSALARFERIGITPNHPFDFDNAPPAVKAALQRAAVDALQHMKNKLPTIATVVNGWQMNTQTMGVYGNAYLKRAIIAMVGLGANQPEDAIYPLAVADSNGQPLTGDRRYILRFQKDQLPPVDAFWSITMYDAEGFQVANPLNRFALGDRDPLVYNPDGSLEIYIQSSDPGDAKRDNWLPSPPSGVLGVTMRLYAPRPEALDGRWTPPAIQPAR